MGITQPDPGYHAVFYRDWLGRGYHAEMSYLARPDAVAKRADPRRIMAETRSILVVGINYFQGQYPPTESPVGRVSRYAWGADYHDVVLTKLQQLADWIEGQLAQPLACRAYVDTGPVLERGLGQWAGLGWIGKNTSLIHPRRGSYFFLGELLLSLELTPDPPFISDHCGRCTACLDACPTGALEAPRTIDAHRCISYLTVEHRGAIPTSLRPLLGDRVFGCDACQEACPWNHRFARPSSEPAFDRRQATLDLVEILTLDEDGFRRRFHCTALWRARRAGLLRNAAVVAGNLRNPVLLPVLRAASSDPEPLVSQHAAWALRRIKGC